MFKPPAAKCKVNGVVLSATASLSNKHEEYTTSTDLNAQQSLLVKMIPNDEMLALFRILDGYGTNKQMEAASQLIAELNSTGLKSYIHSPALLLIILHGFLVCNTTCWGCCEERGRGASWYHRARSLARDC